MFKKLKASLGMGGGAEVETVLEDAEVRPGEQVRGRVTVRAGEVEQEVSYLEVALQARVEVEGEDVEWEADQVFHRRRITEAFTLAPGDEREVAFTLDVPYETPFTVIEGYALDKVKVGVRTELEIARSLDATDVDPLTVHGLPVHEQVIAAVEALDFPFVGSDLEQGRVPGASLPFYQEVEYGRSPRFGRLNQLEVTFITDASSVDVLLEGDRRGGFLTEGSDTFQRFTLPLDGGGDVAAQVEAAIARLNG